MPELNREVPIPLYYQLKQLLKEQIRSGILKSGDKLPNEDELCKKFAISRTPVRQALTDLVHEGLLVRIPARGTFVTEPASRSKVTIGTTIRVVVSDVRWREPLEGAASLWSDAHPDDPIRLDIHMVPHAELRSSLIACVGRGEAPDISLLDSVWVAEFAHQSYLRPLDDIDPAWLHINRDSYFPITLVANRYQGYLFAMPISADVSVLWYRRDWLEREGLTPPGTWEELVAAAKYFRQPEVRSRYGLLEYPVVFVGGRRGGETTTHQLLPLLWTAGGDLISDDQVVLDSPSSRRALSFLKGLIHEHHVAPPEVVDFAWDQAAHFFAEGKAAFAFGGSYESFFLQHLAGWDDSAFEEHVGFAPIPAERGERPAVLAGGMSYVIYRQSHVPKQAFRLIEMTGRPEVLRHFCVRTGHIPPRIPVAQKLMSVEDSIVARTIPFMEVARARPVIPEYARVSEQFQTMIEESLTGKRQIDEIVSLTSERISAITGFPIVRRTE